MARYYRVLSQDEKNSEEVTQFYPNLDENQTVQYVIASDNSQQQFQTQPVVVSSDQLMVVEGQGQQVIIDQSQVAYQPSSYVIQDNGGLDFQNNGQQPQQQQQVYYMTNTQSTQPIVVEQPLTQQPQPVVLNHQIMQNQMSKVSMNSTVHQSCSPTSMASQVVQEKNITPMQQIRNQLKPQSVRQNSIMNTRGIQLNTQKVTQGMSQGVLQNFTRKNPNEKECLNKEEDDEILPFADGSLVNYSQYRKFMAQQKQPNQTNEIIPERLSPAAVQLSQRKPRNTPPNRFRAAKPKLQQQQEQQQSQPQPQQQQQHQQQQSHQPPIRMNRNNVFMQNAPLDDRHASVKPNISPQFPNQIPQRQQQSQQTMTSRPQPPPPSPMQQNSQNQYVIQPPRPRDSRPQNPRPLPHFIYSTQIRNIIENTPQSEEYSDSIRMLVLLDNGEQRLITFTLPNEACTIQEILQQVGVPFVPDSTPIQVSEANANGLNYVVAVGNIPGFNMDVPGDDVSSLESDYMQHQQQQQQLQHQQMQSQLSLAEPEPESEPIKPPSPEIPKELPPKLIEGQLAVCANCGYLSEDFNKCTRCKRKLPENVKSVPAAAANNNSKKLDPRGLVTDKRVGLQKTNGVPRMNLLPKKRPSKPKILECETVVVSSDEEDSDKKTSVKNVNEHLLEKLGAAVTISPISKEPSIIEIQKTSMQATTKGSDKDIGDQLFSTLVLCRTVRIGSYRFVPPEPVRIDSNGVTLKVPHPRLENTLKIIKIESSDIVKVLISFQKSLPVLFYYLLPSVGNTIRSALDMTPGSDCYFDPLSEVEEAHRRITLLPETLSDECKHTLQKIYMKNFVLDELTYKEANDILIKTCPRELSKSVLNYSNVSEIKPILVYPPEGRGRITINTEDYMCLGQDQFLNDVIIDFYLKYLLLNLPKEKQEKVHIFSTFFYKRLTTKPMKASRKSQPAELDPNLTPSQKRHSRVKTWTKNVNIFEKDFIIVPINENCHWFLAIICYPNMNGSQTMDGQPIKIEPKQSKKKKLVAPLLGNISGAVKEKKVEQSIMCEDAELSDKDEAEGDDSELDSDDSEEFQQTLSVENNSKRPPIKQPCILIFDSLAGASRSRVVATLRDYLTCEYKAKLNIDKNFTKDVIKGACPKVPQQTNFTDCGLYLLQYVEQFFNDPIKDYYIPISHLKTWFEEITVTKKREDISLLIQSLMKQYGKDLDLLPDVVFPTQNGELAERAVLEKEDKFIDPDEAEETMEEEDEEYLPPSNKTKKIESVNEHSDSSNLEKSTSCPIKPSSESVKSNNDFVEQTIINSTLLKPDISETSKQSSRDTLSYLKAKRIIRHKNSSDGGPDSKKVKNTDSTSDT